MGSDERLARPGSGAEPAGRLLLRSEVDLAHPARVVGDAELRRRERRTNLVRAGGEGGEDGDKHVEKHHAGEEKVDAEVDRGHEGVVKRVVDALGVAVVAAVGSVSAGSDLVDFEP